MKSLWDATWTLEEAGALVAYLDAPLKAAGFAVGIGGSVIAKGRSDHDVDLIIFPMTTAKPHEPELARAVLRRLGLHLVIDRERVVKGWRSIGSRDEKHVEIWERNKKRIDVFYLR
jgi:hypothetical protein